MAWLKSSTLVRCHASACMLCTHSATLHVGREKGLELRGAIDSHLERYGHAQIATAATSEPPSSTEPAPPRPSSTASKAETGARAARTPPAPSAQQAKPRKTTPEAGTGRGYADLNRAGKAKTPT